MDGRSLARLKRELDEFTGELLVDLPRRDQRAWAVAVKSRIVCKCSGLTHAATEPSRTFLPIA